MFYYISGEVTHLEANLAVIDCGGVGYACKTSSYTLSEIKVGTEMKLFTHLYVREDTVEIYGFSTQEELNCFQLLIGVSGVGPKVALAVLSSVSPGGLATAIVTENDKPLTNAPGVGKRLAQRIILELKDKLAKGQIGSPGEQFKATDTVIPEDKTGEASAALAVLGYSQSEINLALKNIPVDDLTLEEVIKQALKKM